MMDLSLSLQAARSFKLLATDATELARACMTSDYQDCGH